MPNRILFITNAELGQANVHLAVIQEILSVNPDLELDLHLLSFAALAPWVAALKDVVAPAKVTFHELQGASWKDALFNRPEHRWHEICGLAPTCFNAVESAPMMVRIVAPWSQDELVDLVQQVEKKVLEIDADLVIVDNLFTPAITIAYELKLNWSILSPNTYREFILGYQPRGEWLWKHPPTASLVPYPVPLLSLPAVLYHQRQYMKNAHNPWVVGHAVNLQEKINRPYSDWGRASFDPPPGLKIILPSNSTVDFPFSVVPDHIVSCGPIVRPVIPVKETDPELDEWLRRRPTVYINLGTHAAYDTNTTLQLAGAVTFLLAEAEKAGKALQVLWKLKTTVDESIKTRVLGGSGDDRIRIVDWLKTEPIAILHSGSVVCSVNHGGANSYFEAISAGVPQVVLPVWFDTYDFARRVEYFGVGKIGNRTNAPKCSADELGPILKRVLLGKEATKMKEKARAIANAVKAAESGRAIAARGILDELRGVQAKIKAEE